MSSVGIHPVSARHRTDCDHEDGDDGTTPSLRRSKRVPVMPN